MELQDASDSVDRPCLSAFKGTPLRHSVNCPSQPAVADAHWADRALVARLLDGEAVAWEQFVDNYAGSLRARIIDVTRSFRPVCDQGLIDDVLAEVFAALLHNDQAALRAYSGRSSLLTYLSVIATRCALRGFAAPQEFVQAELVESVSHHTEQPVEQLMRIEQNQKVVSLIEKLPSKQRSIVQLYHLHDKSYTEISQELGIPLGSVGVTLKRAEEKLRLLLANHEASQVEQNRDT